MDKYLATTICLADRLRQFLFTDDYKVFILLKPSIYPLTYFEGCEASASRGRMEVFLDTVPAARKGNWRKPVRLYLLGVKCSGYIESEFSELITFRRILIWVTVCNNAIFIITFLMPIQN